ncbi:MAG: NAD(P)H-hydrate dehydratase [Desulfuromonadales bacterium]|nr:NAD(P)H-hydrate dehydratase [Desulfuromonadales bacterium]
MNFDRAVLDVRRMGEADRLTVLSGTPVIELMENAGRAVASEIERRWAVRPVVVLCGPGNNGGDGFVVGRLLAAAGWPVRIALLGSLDCLKGEARHHAQLWRGNVEPLAPSVLGGAELVVDAIFGAGLSRALEGPAEETMSAAAQRSLPIVAVDVPSGLMGDTGEALGAVAAALTVTFFRKKPGHLLLPGRMLCGELVVADIGTPPAVLEQIIPDTFENAPELWISDLPQPDDAGNKYTRGHALISGGYPITGAARLAARAAARAGAGLVTIAVPEVALPIYAAALTCIMVQPLAAPDDFVRLLEDRRFSALLIGPGSGAGDDTRARALAMLASGRPTLLDADAITAFQSDPTTLDRAINGPCVLTPHDGEFLRLFDLKGDKLTRTRAASRRSGAIIILKGSDTVITSPDGRIIINSNAPPTLATAGSGDVLSGIVLGLLAQGMNTFLAAAAAVWLHGAAAAEFGPGLIAEDLPDLLPVVFRKLSTTG